MKTQWYYAVEGSSVGPVDQAEFDALVAAGTIRSDTLVWQEGMEDWLPYGRADQTSAQASAPPRAPLSDAGDPARADANTFVGAFKDAIARYVDFKTRSTRSQFWWFMLWSVIISIAASAVDIALGMGDSGPVSLLASLAILLPVLAVTIRRLHDIGRTGWWVLIQFVPIVGFIVIVVFACTKSQEGPNEWGMPPRR